MSRRLQLKGRAGRTRSRPSVKQMREPGPHGLALLPTLTRTPSGKNACAGEVFPLLSSKVTKG